MVIGITGWKNWVIVDFISRTANTMATSNVLSREGLCERGSLILAIAGVGSYAPCVFEIATIREKLDSPTDATKYEMKALFSNKSQVNYRGFSLSFSISSSSFHT